MRLRERVRNVVICGIVLGGLCWWMGRESRSVLRLREGMQGGGHEGGTGALAFANVALGGFRGMLADLLWLRAQQLQEAGRYVELVPLAEGIAALEPDNGEVWAYHAWNLSFNVCAMMGRAEDRWRWVLAGIDLLQKRGMGKGGRDTHVQRELGWIFQFKLGTDVDRAAWYYRAEWARLMEAYLEEGGEPPAESSLQATELAEVMGLDASRMAELDERFGPLDWRAPGSHAVYWGMDGLAHATEKDRLHCRRQVYQSLVQMVQHSGRVVGDVQSEEYRGELGPNVDLIAGTRDFFLETCEEHSSRNVRVALMGFFFDTIRIYAREGAQEDAREAYAELCSWFEEGTELPTFEQACEGSFDFSKMPWHGLLDMPVAAEEECVEE